MKVSSLLIIFVEFLFKFSNRHAESESESDLENSRPRGLPKNSVPVLPRTTMYYSGVKPRPQSTDEENIKSLAYSNKPRSNTEMLYYKKNENNRIYYKQNEQNERPRKIEYQSNRF
jgi:hypothetical protein